MITPMPIFLYDSLPSTFSTIGINAGIFLGIRVGSVKFNTIRTPINRLYTLAFFSAPSIFMLKNTTIKNEYKINATPTNPPLKGNRETNEIGISPGFAFFHTRDKITLGVATGWEIPLNSEGRKWIYANKQYLGIILSFKV